VNGQPGTPSDKHILTCDDDFLMALYNGTPYQVYSVYLMLLFHRCPQPDLPGLVCGNS